MRSPFVPAAPYQIALLASAVIIASAPVCADAMETKLGMSIKPPLLTPRPGDKDSGESQDAQLNSGLTLSLRNKLVDVAVDYNLQGLQKERGTVYENKVDASLHSTILNKLLRLNTRVKANSMVRSGGDIYQHRIGPEFSKSLLNIATLNANYQYALNKPSAQAVENQQRGYSLGLKGDLQGGRLSWNGDYKASGTYKDRLLLTKSTEELGFRTSYRLIPEVQLDVSSTVKHQTLFTDAADNAFAETRYGAGLAWSPSERYALAFKVNRLHDSRAEEPVYLRSGTVSWFPRRDLTLSVDYGDQLVEGLPGVMISTRLKLDPS